MLICIGLCVGVYQLCDYCTCLANYLLLVKLLVMVYCTLSAHT